MYSTSLMTDGSGIENRAECSHRGELSSAWATPLRINTTARRAVQTLIGSKEALRTKTREFILRPKYSKGRRPVASGQKAVGSRQKAEGRRQ